MPRFIPPQLATLVDAPPSGPDWAYEIKYDGYRLEALIDNGEVRLFTRRGNDWTDRFAGIAARLARFPVKSAILDGEVVVLDPAGRSVFALLQRSLEGSQSQDHTFFIFDLLQLDGTDWRMEPLAARRKRLEQLLRSARATTQSAVRLGQRLEGDGSALLRAACGMGLEGIIAKRTDAAYSSTRARSWVKIKCGHRQEFVVVGFTPPKGSRTGIGALLLAVHENGALRYAGRVGSGIPDDLLRDLALQLNRLEIREAPLPALPAGLPGSIRWVRPTMVVEVSFGEWTTDGLLRHPVFVGVRVDKPAGDVRREAPEMTQPRGAAPVQARRAAAPVVAGVTITHPDRLVYPDAGVSKLELARYFEHVAPSLLRHAGGRPLSLLRCPEGVAGQCFFQKHWPGATPPAIDTVPIRQSDGVRRHVVIHDVAGLVTLVQWGAMEIHVWGSRADDPERPDRIIFDLDPGPGVAWHDVTAAAGGLRGLLDGLGLASWLKTTGGKGLHVVVPIARRSTWDDVSSFARRVAGHMQAEFPDRFIAKASKSARNGLIFVDWLRNTRGATAIAPWSTRARAEAGISVPISWSQLSRVRSGDEFALKPGGAALPRGDDPWHDLATSRQALTRAMLAKLR